ncbi:alpha/beta hydrolase [Amycolatopsis nigrescens]|uniref:alpha/beta hydrolase n=1 Tax=Amycolatopsis nigrescens TaxID=381445 RepID=UPI0003711983|nr:alpha/beta hydrolase [Amycolatopsis nigrescens]
MTGVLIAAGAIAVPATVNAMETGGKAAAIDWQPCPDGKGAQCATIEVPLDWSQPDGAKTKIGIAKRQAKDQANRIGTILVDPGGPGGSGVSMVSSGDPFTEAVTARFDVVGFDPRGINTSQQLLCDEALSQQATDARHPAGQADFDKLVSLNQQLMDSCRAHSGDLIDHVDNLNTARDMDAIRAALGEEKINYVGYSYGSLMGQQYAELFPDRIRAMVNDGNMDHSLPTAWDFMRTETEPVEKNFVEFAKWCDTTETCALHGQDTAKVYGELKEKAKAGKLTDPETGDPVDFYALSQRAFSVNQPPAWGNLATDLKALKDGTGTMSPASLEAAAAVNNPYPPIWCSDWRYPVQDFAEYEKLRTKLSGEFPNIEWSPYVDHALTCAGDPLKTTNPQQPLEIEGAPPLVMVGNIHDPATVYEWNKTAAKQSGSHLITYEGWGHTAYGNGGPSPCVNEAVDAYLLDLTVPAKGLSCPATEKPASPSASTTLNPHSSGPYQR